MNNWPTKSSAVGADGESDEYTPMAPKATGEPSNEVSARPYGAVAIGFHWVSAALIAALWLIAEVVGFMPRALRPDIWSTHVLLGLGLALVIAGRIFWRLRYRPSGPRERGWLDALGRLAHVALYTLMVIAIALGLSDALLRGYNIFGLWALPNLHGSSGLVRDITHWHDVAANILIALALLHAGAALFHHLILGDGVLRRMIPVLRLRDRHPGKLNNSARALPRQDREPVTQDGELMIRLALLGLRRPKHPLRQRLLVTAVAIAALAGTCVAYSSSNTSNPRRANTPTQTVPSVQTMVIGCAQTTGATRSPPERMSDLYVLATVETKKRSLTPSVASSFRRNEALRRRARSGPGDADHVGRSSPGLGRGGRLRSEA
jgi:cytochrome b561